MSDPRSIEEVLWAVMPQVYDDQQRALTYKGGATRCADALASADLPLVDRERGIAVIRLDPEAVLALSSLRWRLVEAITVAAGSTRPG